MNWILHGMSGYARDRSVSIEDLELIPMPRSLCSNLEVSTPPLQTRSSSFLLTRPTRAPPCLAY